MQTSDELRALVPRRIADGTLPSAADVRTWGGYGTGATCTLCGLEIGTTHIEYEVD